MSNSRVISIRVAPNEYDQLTMEASAKSMTVSNYVRHKVFGTVTATPSAYGMLATRMETLENRLAGIDNAIASGRDILGREED